MSAALQPQPNLNVTPPESTRAAPSSPYVGLVPFSEDDAEFFFGRGRESNSIAETLRAARLTLLYGPSGVGKSSVLSAGVVAPLRAIVEHDLTARGAPEFAIVFFDSWSSDPIGDLSKCIHEAVRKCLGQKTIDSLPPSRSLVEIIKAWNERYDIELLIILDQFEQYFLYHAYESGEGTFADEFPRAISNPNLRAHFLLSMRDDTLSKLDRFKGSIPTLFDNRLQIEYLDLESAREAIICPVKKYNELYSRENPFKFDHQNTDSLSGETGKSKLFLVDEVLSKVHVGKDNNNDSTGQGVVKKDETASATQAKTPKAAIQAPYLQLVMSRIWNDEETIKSRELKTSTLEKLGGATKIIEQNLDKVMERLSEEEQDIAAAVFYHLVTPTGTKIALTVKDLAEYTKLDGEQIKQLLDNLLKLRKEEDKEKDKEETRILHLVTRKQDDSEIDAYEILHDALAPAVLAWSAKHKSEQEKQRMRVKSRDWMIRIVLIFVVVGTAIIWRIEEQNRIAAEAALRKQRDQDKQNQIDSLTTQRNNLKPYEVTIQALLSLTNGSFEQKDAAIKILHSQIEKKELGELEPLIRPILEEVAKSHPETSTAKSAKAAVNEIARQKQDTRLSPRVYIQIQDEAQREIAKYYQQQLAAQQLTDIPEVRPRILAPGIENAGPRRNVTVPELRYFHRSDLERRIGEKLREILISAGLTNVQLKLIGGYEDSPDIRPNHFELWLSGDLPTGDAEAQ